MGKGSLIEKQSRRDRLVGLLKSQEIWTSEKLCYELDVSQRTLMRDLSELRESGVPIESERGRGGGIRMEARWGVDRLNLSHREVISLLVSLVIAESISPTLFHQSSKSIRQKLAMAFPDGQRKQINKFRDRILIGEPASAHILEKYQQPSHQILEVVTEAFYKFQKVEIVYQSEKSEQTQRTIEPQFLMLSWPVWYLLSWDELREDIRVFRIDRIVSARLIDAKMSHRKKGLFLEAYQQYFARI